MDLSKIELERIDGTKESMEKYLGNILLIVNTASKCGFTPQYEALEALYKKYHEKGFEIFVDVSLKVFDKLSISYQDLKSWDFPAINSRSRNRKRRVKLQNSVN